jgi:hypothetical protein
MKKPTKTGEIFVVRLMVGRILRPVVGFRVGAGGLPGAADYCASSRDTSATPFSS